MTPITPPPGLLDKVAEAMHEGLPCHKHRDGECAYMPKARAAWDAVVEGLGLTEEERGCTHGGFHVRPVEGFTSVYTSVGATCDSVACARLVSRWEPQP